MSVLRRIRTLLRNNYYLRSFFAHTVFPSGLFDSFIKNYKMIPEWENRIKLVLECSDNDKIKRVPDAGIIVKGKQIMHNGLKVNIGSYYGPEYSKLLYYTKGVHEPQEEYVFELVLKDIPDNAVMIELGAYWSFYSMWFNKEIPGAVNYMIEPDRFNLKSGKLNFKINGMKGDFTHAFISQTSGELDGVAVVGIDDFAATRKIKFIDILHSDIQGYEFEMLKGTKQLLASHSIGYLFISTHTNEVHYECLEYLKQSGYTIVCAADLDQTYSQDGLIVAKSPKYKGIEKIEIALRK